MIIAFKTHVAPLAALVALTSALLAAPPALSGGAAGLAPKAGPGLVRKFARPRAAAFLSMVYPDIAPAARVAAAPAARVQLTEGYEIIVFAPHRPIRATVRILYSGKPLADRWTEALKIAYQGFDRDGDGTLNGYEVQYIFSDLSLGRLVQTGFYAPNPDNLPTLDKLDLDRDRQISFDEFAAYYTNAASRAIQAFPAADESPTNALTTEALFKLMDHNGDDKLTRDEVAAVEKLLASKDADEDECLSVQELVGNGGADPRFRVQFQTNGQPAPRRVPQNVVPFELGRIPGTIIQKRIIPEYDKNNDFELTQAECGFDDATFARLDFDGSGKLSGAELDRWRTGPADLEATLSLAPQAADCKAAITTDKKQLFERGFTTKVVESGRVVVRHGRQPIEFWAFAPSQRNGRTAQLKQSYGALFLFQQLAGNKGYIEEKDFSGNNAFQFQQIRVIVDPADFNSDGRLTREEFDKYFDLQQPFVDLGMGLAPAVQTPTLFQLLDENRDGRLGVRELRTAWSRLIALEPAGPDGKSEVVTRLAIQPSVSLRLSRTLDRGIIGQQVFFPNQNSVSVPQKGPQWFRKMDRNADGDVSRLEFLGTRAEFDAIDRDGDGLISLEEAETYDKQVRGGSEKK
jgi:Ca2+-binding EF-hand superfamily protein